MPRGTPKPPKGDADNRRGLARENESAQMLAKAGYDIEQLPESKLQTVKNPDYRIGGRIFDNYAPTSSNVDRIGDAIEGKVERGQTDRVVVNLADTPVTAEDVRNNLHTHPKPGLKEAIVIDQQGRITHVYP